MSINRDSESFDSTRKKKEWDKFILLVEELQSMELIPEVKESLDQSIQEINAFAGADVKLIKLARKKRNQLLQLLEKKMKIVAKNQHRLRWLALGMSTFGIPLGLAIGLSLQNMAFLGIGIPIGLALGVGIGTAMDQKAAQEGRQLKFEL